MQPCGRSRPRLWFLRLAAGKEIFGAMKVLRLLRNMLIALASIILVALLCVGGVWLYFHPRLEVTKGVVYGHRQGEDLTIDVLRPAHPNGVGIVLMASGGWKSEAGSFRHWIAAPILRRGYTVFAVNPNADQVEGDTCYHDLSAIPGGVDAVVIGTKPATAEAAFQRNGPLGLSSCPTKKSK